MKICKKCNVEKELNDFRKLTRSKDGYRQTCIECVNALSRQRETGNPKTLERRRVWRGKNKDKIKAADAARYARNPEKFDKRNKRYRDENKEHISQKRFERNTKKYGITQGIYEEAFAKQKGLCLGCLQPESVVKNGKIQRLAIDHCHGTGIVRGLLCSACNFALGKVKDNPETLERLARYVRAAQEE